jgi:hypothetical protein
VHGADGVGAVAGQGARLREGPVTRRGAGLESQVDAFGNFF